MVVGEEEPLLKPERAGDKLVVRLRRQCRDPSAAERLCADLEKLVGGATKAIAFKDFDISQNTFSMEQFDRIFQAFSKPFVSIQILRLFGSATLDDRVCGLMAVWLVNAVALIELHLSDCAITRVGFDLLMDALAANPAFPRGGCNPLFVRLENNYISQEAFDVAIAKGIRLADALCPDLVNTHKTNNWLAYPAF